MKIKNHEFHVGDSVVLDLNLRAPNEVVRGKVICEHAEHLCIEVEVPDEGFPRQGKGCDGLLKVPYPSAFWEDKGRQHYYGIRPSKEED